MSRMELETEVSDTEVLKNILIHLDFSPVASVIKLRKYLKCGRFTACLDQVEGLGDFLELEVIAEQDRLLISVCFRKRLHIQKQMDILPDSVKLAGIFSYKYLSYRIRKCSCFFFSYNIINSTL